MSTAEAQIVSSMRAGDWRASVPARRRRVIAAWYWTIAAVTFLVLIVGGATRLTHSGLSMVQWEPIVGIVPPLTDADWHARFAQYQQFPEYQKLRQGMSLSEFKFIFFWEYLHRVLARSIGIVFLVPFAFFAAKRWLNRPLAVRSLALFGLGALQGLMGWLMVASGLVDRPSVSHFRLAAHLSLAFVIFGTAVWLARDLHIETAANSDDAGTRARLRRALVAVGALLAIQVVWGAFVAGLKAGFFANTFPLMGGRLVPAGLLEREPWLSNFVSNPVAVQWSHRVIGTLLAVAVLVLAALVLRRSGDALTRRFAAAFGVLIVVQYLLGVATLLHAVPIALGVTHQATALVLFGTWVAWLHHMRRTRPDVPAR